MSRTLPLLLLAGVACAEPLETRDDPLVDARYERLVALERADWLAAALERRESLRPVIDPALHARDLPPSVAAVALVESGFQNIEARPDVGLPAGGVWQMIPSTAEAYGLRVDPEVDERQDVVRETEAALDLLVDLKREHGDWGLAFAAYNVGSPAVRRAVDAHGTDDVCDLIRAGALPPYAADVLAAARVLDATAARR